MTEHPGIPEWHQLGIPVDDRAEPDDAGIKHTWNGEDDGR